MGKNRGTILREQLSEVKGLVLSAAQARHYLPLSEDALAALRETTRMLVEDYPNFDQGEIDKWEDALRDLWACIDANTGEGAI